MVRIAMCTILAILVGTGVMAAEAQKEEVRTFPMKRGAKLTLRMQDGSLRLSTWSKEEAEVRVVRRAWGRSKRDAEDRLEDIEVAIRPRSSGDLEIVVYDHGAKPEISFWDLFDPDTWRSEPYVEVHFEIHIPSKSQLWTEVEDANVQIEGDFERLTLEADDGDIELQKVSASSIRIETDDGDIGLYATEVPDGRAILFTDDGRVRVEESRLRDVDVETDDADVVLLNLESERVDVRTGSGDVELESDLRRASRIRVDSEDGDVILTLPSGADVELDLETDTGRIRSDFDIEVEDTDEGERVRDRLGSGRVRVVVTSEDGDIILERR